jgi:hypothetical protein
MFFFEKRTKKLLDFGVREPASLQANEQKSFASFLQKRRPSFLEFKGVPAWTPWLPQRTNPPSSSS